MKIPIRDVARFAIADPPEVVKASFCCQLCLHQADLVIVLRGDDGGVGWCWCVGCGEHTEVLLTPDQLLRLAVAPPRGTPLRMIEGRA